MKKYIFSTVCVLFLFTSSLLSQNQLSEQQCYQILVDKGLVDTTNDAVFAFTEIIPPNTVLENKWTRLSSPDWNCWLFFIDKDPHHNGLSHPLKYVYMNPIDGSYRVVQGNDVPSSVGGKVEVGTRFFLIPKPMYFPSII
jgi:hypothetical protein